MPPLETMDRHQTAVLWPAAGTDEYGQPLTSSPQEISVRWNKNRSEGVDRDGTKITLDATVVTDVEVAFGSLLWLGELADWAGTGSAADPDDDVMVVKTRKTTKDLKGRNTRTTLGLVRFRNSLPG